MDALEKKQKGTYVGNICHPFFHAQIARDGLTGDDVAAAQHLQNQVNLL